MNELETKRIVVNRIISHLNPVPANAVNELFQQTLPDLEAILTKLATTREQENVEEAALAQIREAQAERASDGAWGGNTLPGLAKWKTFGGYRSEQKYSRRPFESGRAAQ
jgi:hypothetical protein